MTDEVQNNSPTTNCVAKIDASEIMVGSILAVGTFNTVIEILSFDLCSKYTARDREEEELRNTLSKKCIRYRSSALVPEPRYVMKRLRWDVQERLRVTKNTCGALVNEMKFLSQFDHPFIVRMYAQSITTHMEADFFVVLDRIVGGLDGQMRTWRDQLGHKSKYGTICPKLFSRCLESKKHKIKDKSRQKIWLDQLQGLIDISKALSYIHSKRYVRDHFRSLRMRRPYM